MGGARVYLGLDHLLAWCAALLGLSQAEVCFAFIESEIIALSEAAKDVVHLRKFVRGLVPSISAEPTILSTDNKAARDLSYNPEHHGRSIF